MPVPRKHPGEVELFQGRSYKSYRGMGSLGAMQQGSKDRYFQHDTSADKLVPEGIEGGCPTKAPCPAWCTSCWAGCVRPWVTWAVTPSSVSAPSPRFVRITNAGIRESHAHDVQITKEAPNYKLL